MGQRIILSENEKLNIQKMYGLIIEQDSKKINRADIPNNWIGKQYPSSLSGNFLTVETDEGKVLVDGIVRGLRGIVKGTLTTNSFKELYDKYGYMIFTLSERMAMYSKYGVDSPYSIFTSEDKGTNKIIFPKGQYVFDGDLSKLEETINQNKNIIKKIKLSVEKGNGKLPKGSEHFFMPIDTNYKDGDGYIIPTKLGEPPRYIEDGEYEIIK